MKVNVGDKVKFLNESGGGTVARVVNEKMVHVQIEDGFEIPVLISELLKVGGAGESEGNSYNPESKREIDKKEIIQKIGQDKMPKEMNFIIMDANRSGVYDTWLVNSSGYDILFIIYSLQGDDYILLKTGVIKNMEKQALISLKDDVIVDISKFIFQCLLIKHKSQSIEAPLEKEIAINWLRLKKGGYYTENVFFKQKAACFPIVDFPEESTPNLVESNDLRKAFNQKIREDVRQSIRPAAIQEPKKSLEIEEIDLHIEQLIENHQGLMNKEILDIQMARFTTALEGGLRNNVRRMVFIHGLGNGKLKYEISKELEKKYPKLKYQDASFKEYGYGATLVILK